MPQIRRRIHGRDRPECRTQTKLLPRGHRYTVRGLPRTTQTPAPARPIPRSMAGPGLLAHILVSKFDDHLPLYRQNEILARMGAEIPASTLVDWCGHGVRVLYPLVARIRADVMTADRLYADGEQPRRHALETDDEPGAGA